MLISELYQIINGEQEQSLPIYLDAHTIGLLQNGRVEKAMDIETDHWISISSTDRRESRNWFKELSENSILQEKEQYLSNKEQWYQQLWECTKQIQSFVFQEVLEKEEQMNLNRYLFFFLLVATTQEIKECGMKFSFFDWACDQINKNMSMEEFLLEWVDFFSPREETQEEIQEETSEEEQYSKKAPKHKKESKKQHKEKKQKHRIRFSDKVFIVLAVIFLSLSLFPNGAIRMSLAIKGNIKAAVTSNIEREVSEDNNTLQYNLQWEEKGEIKQSGITVYHLGIFYFVDFKQ